MHFHWQNLKEDRRGAWLHGRAWLHASKPGRAGARVEWLLSKWNGLRLMFTYGSEEDDFHLGIGLGFVTLWFALSFLKYDAFDRTVFGRETGFYYVDDHLVLKWRCDDSSWTKRDGPAKGWSKGWFIKDLLFGQAEYSTTTIGKRVYSVISMPENTYSCRVQLTLDVWKRPRWPWPKKIRRAHIVMYHPIPIPGKGENAWDCGEDATHSCTLPADSIQDALDKFTTSTYRRREQYGGKGWVPERYRL